MKTNRKQIVRPFCVAVFMSCLAPMLVAAQNAELKIPANVKPFGAKAARAVAV